MKIGDKFFERVFINSETEERKVIWRDRNRY